MGQQRSYRTPTYQVDFTASADGKKIGATKRKISFKFGFANPEALKEGCVGVDCRGQEHEILCVWSVTSGKRQIFVDGQEVHHSVTSKAQKKFECTFGFQSEHMMKLIAHAAPPIAKDNGFKQRQFDLFLDGQSFFEMKRLFELGQKTRPSRTMSAPPRSFALVSPNNYDTQEYMNYSFAEEPPALEHVDSRDSIRSVSAYQDYDQSYRTKPSIESNTYQQRRQPPPAIEERPVEEKTVDLLDLNGVHETQLALPPAPVPPPSVQTQSMATQAVQAPPAPTYINIPMQTAPVLVPAVVEPSPTNYYGQQPMQVHQPTTMSPYQKFQYQNSSYEIMQKYQEQRDASPVPPMSTEDCTDIVAVSPDRSSPVGRLTMAPVDHFVVEEDRDVDEVSKAVKNLCNLDHIHDDSHAKHMAKLAEKKEGNVVKDKHGNLKSKGLAPKATLNKGASLMDIQATKQQSAPTKVVMEQRPMYHQPSGVAPGALVVYGAPQQGPPSIPRGFGVGAQPGYTNYAY